MKSAMLNTKLPFSSIFSSRVPSQRSITMGSERLLVSHSVWLEIVFLVPIQPDHDTMKLWVSTLKASNKALYSIRSKLYKDQTGQIAGTNESSRLFDIKRGVRQGRVLSPRLGRAVLSMAMGMWRHTVGRLGLDLGDGGPTLLDLRFADDFLISATTYIDAGLLLDELVLCLSQAGLVLNTDKTKVMITEAQPPSFCQPQLVYKSKFSINSHVINGLAACWVCPQWTRNDTTLINICKLHRRHSFVTGQRYVIETCQLEKGYDILTLWSHQWLFLLLDTGHCTRPTCATLMSYCASPRCNYQLRMLPPSVTHQFAQDHDAAVAGCLAEMLDCNPPPATALATAHLPLRYGGLGLTSASILATPAYWASWADALQVLGRQAPQQAATLLHQFQSEEPPPSIREAAEAAAQLQQHGFEPPAWDQLMNNPPVPPDPHPHEGPNIMKGWQQGAANACHTTFQAELHSCLDPASQALLESQRGPHASRPFTTIPYHADTTYESHLFRILLLRRLRLPIPLTASHCRCRRALDPYGDHHAACAQSGILRNRAGPLERAKARMCREAGARVTTNTLLTNLNIEHSTRPDDRRIEVIAKGLTLWGGTQLAIDTTLVSPLTRDGQPRRRAGRFTGAALQDARRRKERTYPELIGSRRCRLVVLGIETGGRWSEEASMFVKLLAQAKARQAPPLLQTSLAAALISRWTASLSHAAMHAFAASLLAQDCSNHTNVEGNQPTLSQVLAEAPLHATAPSRLPARS